KDAVDGATECGAHFCVAWLAVDPAFKETADDSVPHRKLSNTGADGFYLARTVGERHQRKLLARAVTALDDQEISIVQGCCLEPNQHLALTRLRDGLVHKRQSIDSTWPLQLIAFQEVSPSKGCGGRQNASDRWSVCHYLGDEFFRRRHCTSAEIVMPGASNAHEALRRSD